MKGLVDLCAPLPYVALELQLPVGMCSDLRQEPWVRVLRQE